MILKMAVERKKLGTSRGCADFRDPTAVFRIILDMACMIGVAISRSHEFGLI